MGSKCKYCKKDMATAKGCVLVPVVLKDGRTMKPIKFGEEDFIVGDDIERCGDCGCEVGHYHHSGCDIERCPNCRGQIISCDCLKEE